MYLFIDSMIWIRPYSDLMYFDIIRFFIPKPKDIEHLETDYYSWNQEKHLWETNPFKEDLYKWLLWKRWAVHTCFNMREHTLEFYNDSSDAKRIKYSYYTYWWDHLEAWMYISKREWLKIDAECIYEWWRVDYTIDNWVLVQRVEAEETERPDWITEDEWIMNLTNTVHILNQESYDRMLEHNPWDLYFVTE